MKKAHLLLKKHLPFLVLSLVLLTAIALISFSLAWFGKPPLSPVGGEVMPGYFAGGKGTAEQPYVINRPIHLYNLAWLQNTGRFNQPDENGTYTQHHFVLAADLDMKDIVLPPIGTITYPFIGTFESETSISDGVTDEVKYTIRNLTVSNVIGSGEIEKRPQSVVGLNGAEIIGMFGVIGVYDLAENYQTYGNIVPSVSDFYLESPVIRAQTQKALMGLIAGYVNGKVHEVGVQGGKLLSGTGNTAGLTNENVSFYGLIGDRAADVSWGGVPTPGGQGAGGALKVDANDTATYNAVNSLTTSNASAEVPDSQQRAFFVDTADDISTTTFSRNGICFYNQKVTSATGTVTGNGSNYINYSTNDYTESWLSELNSSFTYNEDLAYRLEHGGNRALLLNSAAPSPTRTHTITANGKSISVPDGALWFKPLAYGDCIISFGVTNMSSTRYKSIYKFKRLEGGAIDQSSWTETKLAFNKSYLSNKYLVFYHYEITEQDILDGYEYCIGTSSGTTADSTVVFYFLALAGTSSTGGTITPESKELFEVNFIHTLPYPYESVLGPEYRVTTFMLTLPTTNAGNEYYVTFARESMTTHATATTPGGFTVKKYEHLTPPQT